MVYIRLGILVALLPWLNILVHELGHLVIGLILRYRFISLRCLGFVIYRECNRGIWIRYIGKGYTYGQVCMCPEGSVYNRLYDLGGILGQCVLLLVFISMWNVYSIPGVIFTGLILLSNLYPVCKGGIITDGYFYFKLSKNDREILTRNLRIYLEHTYKSYKDIDNGLYDLSSSNYDLLSLQNIYLGVMCKYIVLGDYDMAEERLRYIYNKVSSYDTLFMLEVLSDLYTIYILSGRISKLEGKELGYIRKNANKVVGCARVVYMLDKSESSYKDYKRLYNNLLYSSRQEYEDNFLARFN